MFIARIATESQWIVSSSVLAAGTQAVSSDKTEVDSDGNTLYHYKILDGVNTWANVSYVANVCDIPEISLDINGNLLIQNTVESGYSGFSGSNGTNGTNGYSGYSGTVGTSGYSGSKGYSGYSGVSGYSGIL